MAVNVIVAAVTLLMAGFAAVWLLAPQLRPWLERPKYRLLEGEKQFPPIVRTTSPTDRAEA